MYNWTNDLPVDKNSLEIFLEVIKYFNKKNNHSNNILEIGTFVGTSAIKLVELINNSKITTIDTWKNYSELSTNKDLLDKIEENNIEKIFYDNVEKSGFKDRFTPIKGDSFYILLDFIRNNKTFNFIYVDGNHRLLPSYLDIKLSFEILEKGGILVLDDVPYNLTNTLDSIFQGAKEFMENNQEKFKVLNIGYRVFLEKL
jgi:predicted O-methyltransferase YrrM